jgi:AraC-like DNA-binding protein
MTAAWPTSRGVGAPAALVSALHTVQDSLHDRLAALGWLDFDAGSGAVHANLPADVFIVTLQLADTPQALAQRDDELHIVITPPRETARQFRVAGRRQIAVATLTVRGMLALFGSDSFVLADQPVPLAQLCPRARVQQLRRALQNGHGLDAGTAAFGRWLEDGLLQSGPPTRAEARMERTALRISTMVSAHFDVQALAALEGVTRRQLERDFKRRLGLSPGGLARVVRFQRAAAAVSSGMALADSATVHGYADQAHMNRAFKAYAAMTPRELAQEGARPGREQLRAGLAGRVVLLDLPPLQTRLAPLRRLTPATPQGVAPHASPHASPHDWQRQVMARWAA